MLGEDKANPAIAPAKNTATSLRSPTSPALQGQTWNQQAHHKILSSLTNSLQAESPEQSSSSQTQSALHWFFGSCFPDGAGTIFANSDSN
jgi:hypothetical protein